MIGSRDASSSLLMFSVRRRCAFSNGAHENDRSNVEAKVCPPSGWPWGNGGSCMCGCWPGGGCAPGWGCCCNSWMPICWYCPSALSRYWTSSMPGRSSFPISSPSSLSFFCFTNARCFRCRSLAAARTFSRRAASSGESSSPFSCCVGNGVCSGTGMGSSGGGGGGGCTCCIDRRLFSPAWRSLSRFRRCLSAAFSRLLRWLSVSFSRERLRDDGGVAEIGAWWGSMGIKKSIFVVVPRRCSLLGPRRGAVTVGRDGDGVRGGTSCDRDVTVRGQGRPNSVTQTFVLRGVGTSCPDPDGV
jgi:hypothetical protein